MYGRIVFNFFVAASSLYCAALFGQDVRAVRVDQAAGRAEAVHVKNVPLLYTTQLLPVDAEGKVVHTGDAAAQLGQLMKQLGGLLAHHKTDPQRLVKLNLYVAREGDCDACRKALAANLSGEHRPAVSMVVTRLPKPEALVALDAVAAIEPSHAGNESGTKRSPKSAVLPAGSRVFISGQAEPGESLAEATRKTLAGLTESLKHCGRSDQDIVQLKCFMLPMHSASAVAAEVASYYGADHVPPLVMVEWESKLPIEIEVVAAGGPAKESSESLHFVTPPALKPSPVFSRVAIVDRGELIFLSEVNGPAGQPPMAEITGAFDLLKSTLEKNGSDLKHLVKATYYITNDEVSQQLGAIRPSYYDPQRPPAASKAQVVSTGRAKQGFVMDMIAVPAPAAAK